MCSVESLVSHSLTEGDSTVFQVVRRLCVMCLVAITALTVLLWLESYFFRQSLQYERWWLKIGRPHAGDDRAIHDRLIVGTEWGRLAFWCQQTGDARFLEDDFQLESEKKTYPRKPKITVQHGRAHPDYPRVGEWYNWHCFNHFGFSFMKGEFHSHTRDGSAFDDRELDFAIPLPLLVIGPGIMTAIWLRRKFISRQRMRRVAVGLCITCGYDLRGALGRCPECGMERKAVMQKADDTGT